MDANLTTNAAFAAGAAAASWSQLWAVLLTAAGAIGATLAFVSKSRDFITEPRQRRLDVYLQLSEEFDDAKIRKVRAALAAKGDEGVTKLTIAQKNDYCAFFEELALVVYSRLMKMETAHYMFGEFLRECHERDAFWGDDFPRGDYYWSLFETFARDMKRLGEKRKKAFRAEPVTRLGV